MLNLEPIKDVSSALCLVWSHKSAVLGSVQGHDNTHYSHYLPDRPINSHGHDKVPLSEMPRPIGSLAVISLSARSKSSNGGEETGRWRDDTPGKEPRGGKHRSHFQRGGGYSSHLMPPVSLFQGVNGSSANVPYTCTSWYKMRTHQDSPHVPEVGNVPGASRSCLVFNSTDE